MAIDNVLALFMLPLFGALSDKVDTKIGKRMPFIVGGYDCGRNCHGAFARGGQSGQPAPIRGSAYADPGGHEYLSFSRSGAHA